MLARPGDDCSIQAGRAPGGARHVADNGSTFVLNPFMVHSLSPQTFLSPSPSSSSTQPLEIPLATQAEMARRDIQDWRQKMDSRLLDSVRPPALRDEKKNTSATDAAGPPNITGCPRQASSRQGDAKRKRDDGDW